MTVDLHILSILSVVFLSAFIRSTFGFGEALIAMPVLAIIVGLKTATPVVAMISTTIAFTMLLKSWRSVQLTSAWRLIISSLVGIPLGLLFLKGAYDAPMKLILAVVIISFATYSLVKPKLLVLRTERYSYIFGFLAGILGGAYNTHGPPIVIYGSLRQWAPNSFKATLQGYFFVTGILILLGHCSAGLWTRSVWQLYCLSLPVILLAVLLGGWINRFISTGKFDRYIHLLLIVIGTFLLFETIRGMLTAW